MVCTWLNFTLSFQTFRLLCFALFFRSGWSTWKEGSRPPSTTFSFGNLQERTRFSNQPSFHLLPSGHASDSFRRDDPHLHRLCSLLASTRNHPPTICLSTTRSKRKSRFLPGIPMIQLVKVGSVLRCSPNWITNYFGIATRRASTSISGSDTSTSHGRVLWKPRRNRFYWRIQRPILSH